jgi:hypothetical protein
MIGRGKTGQKLQRPLGHSVKIIKPSNMKQSRAKVSRMTFLEFLEAPTQLWRVWRESLTYIINFDASLIKDDLEAEDALLEQFKRR